MKTLEFETQLNPDHTLQVPPAVAAEVPVGQTVRVLLVVADPTEEQEWRRLGLEQFLKGYADSDAIYDQLSGG
jgi:hypothetical protein